LFIFDLIKQETIKSNISTNDEGFKAHRAYSPEEVLAAGGTTAFGLKTDKNSTKLINTLKSALPAEPFTNEEWQSLVAQLDKDK
jgi:hypothetical protein